MRNEQRPEPIADDPLRAEARALAASIEAIRTACNKRNPRDFAVGTPEWELACIEFARDLRWALGLDDDTTDVPAADVLDAGSLTFEPLPASDGVNDE